MILEGNQRGGAKDLALHLVKQENDHVDVHELRGFASDNLMGALNEAYAVSRGTKCKQFLYSLSINPPSTESISTEEFEQTIDRAEQTLGLDGQPRAIVFHEKEGRRHAHAVWSRINIEQMKAVQMSHDHLKLESLSREIFIERGWDMPKGFARRSERDPNNFTLAEWQQAKRNNQDTRDIKTAIQDAWSISDGKAAFSHALEERGYKLARGDKGRFIAVDIFGEPYSIPRQLHGINTKQVRQRLGNGDDLPSVDEAKIQIGENMSRTMHRLKDELHEQEKRRREEIRKEKHRLVERQRSERKALVQKLKQREQAEALQRQARFRKGLKGLWDRINGEHKRTRQKNELEAKQAQQRDHKEKDQIITAQLAKRRELKERATSQRQTLEQQRREVQTDLSRFNELSKGNPQTKLEEFKRNRKTNRRRAPPGDREPER